MKPYMLGPMRTPLIIGLLLIAHAFVNAEDIREKRTEQVLDGGSKAVTVARIGALTSETYRYRPDGSLEKHIATDSNPNGRIACRRSYDSQGQLLAFQVFVHNRAWKIQSVRTYNSAGRLVLYAVAEPSGEGEGGRLVFYTSDASDRKTVILGSPEYFQIVLQNHLQAFQ